MTGSLSLSFSLFLFFLIFFKFTFKTIFCHENDVSSTQLNFNSLSPPPFPHTCFSPKDFQFAFNTSFGHVRTYNSAIVLPYPPEKFNLMYIPQRHIRVAFSIWNIKLRRYVRWSELNTVHNRKAHLLFISKDLETFGHVHVEDFWPTPKAEETVFNVLFDFNRAKRWYLIFEVNLALPSCRTSSPKSMHQPKDYMLPSQHSSESHSMYKRHDPMIEKMIEENEKHHSLPLHSKIKLSFPKALDKNLVAISPKKLVSNEVTYGFSIHQNGTYRLPIPLAQLKSYHKNLRNPKATFHSSSKVYQFFSSQLDGPIPVKKCTPIYFFIAKHRSPQLHPVTDLSLLLGGVGHITLFHEDTHSFHHLHAQAFTPEQIPEDVIKNTLSLINDASSSDFPSISLPSFNILQKRSVASTIIDLCQPKAALHHQMMQNTTSVPVGPWIGFPLKLKKKGWWKMILQIQHHKTMIVPSFWIEVA
ncbi:hypothetical protein HMI54_015546 [Coelomomyces lativittatus]|nr:hypothetical protein HMI56_007184 [Coelomomyces lativittatus]KAJ1512722.1 hypothetical protein HMI54_015546 [Coelomomyces lativittatus]KAJ1517067.1 hypothetical protein HMI55_000710 [Coelomomyces lativittatus]